MIRRIFWALLLLPLSAVAAQADDSGYLGIVLGQLPSNESKGAMIQEIFAGSPADRDGLRSGDLIVAMNDREISNSQELLDAASQLKAGDKARCKVRRVGEDNPVDITATLVGRPDKPLPEMPLKERPSLGIAFALRPDGSLMVAAFLPESAAQQAGMQAGDVIASIAGHATKDYAALLSSVSAQKDGDEVRIEIIRNGQTQALMARVKSMTPPYKPKSPS